MEQVRVDLTSFGKWSSSGDAEENLQAQVTVSYLQRLQGINYHRQRIWNYMVQKCHVLTILIVIVH